MKTATTPYRILIIEADPAMLMLLEDFIDECFLRYKIDSVATPDEAALLLQDSGNLYNVVIGNAGTTNAADLDFIKNLLALCAGVPLIMLSSYTNRDQVMAWVKMGVADYILTDDLNASILHKAIVFSVERKAALQELQHSERRYRDLFGYSPLPMWVVDVKTGGILDVNEAAVIAYGYNREEFEQLSVRDIYPSVTDAELQKWLTEDGTNEVVEHGVFEHHSRSGAIMQMDVKSRMMMFEGRSARLIIANDVTRLRSYIKAIEEQNERFRQIGWLQSHIVRAPLARIMGLMDMLSIIDQEQDDPADPELSREKILEYIALAVAELDQNVRDVVSKTTRTELD